MEERKGPGRDMWVEFFVVPHSQDLFLGFYWDSDQKVD